LSSVYGVLQVDLDQFIAAVEVLRRPELAGSQWSSAAMETHSARRRRHRLLRSP
jgi:hypothetical protein